MNISEILDNADHRPWQLSEEEWKYYQEWNNAVFLHWQVDLEELQKLVPHELEIDVYEGKPWVSIVAFTMERVRPRGLPGFAPISNFDEINIRTYVKHNNKAGVYFLSIEAGTRISCELAKRLSGLPYRYSKMERENGVFRSMNSEFKDSFELNYRTESMVQQKSNLDNWLIERYALFQDIEGEINEFDIHHVAWPILDLEISELEINYSRFNKLLSNAPNKVQYSTGVQVVAWYRNKRN